MSMTWLELAEQRWEDCRRKRTCVGCPERGSSWCAACRADMNGEGGEEEEAEGEEERHRDAQGQEQTLTSSQQKGDAMNKSNINMENVLPKLPDGFDKGRIVMPKASRSRRRQANTLRLNRCDFDPIEKSGFKGFFAVANKRSIGSKESVAERAKTLVANGGIMFLVRNVSMGDEGFRKELVRLVEAYSYLEGKYVVLHIEPIK